MHTRTCLPAGTSFEILEEPVLGPGLLQTGTGSGYSHLGPSNTGSSIGEPPPPVRKTTTTQPRCFDRDSYPTMKAFNVNYYPTDTTPQPYPFCSVGSSSTSTTRTQPEYSNRDSYPTMKAFDANYHPIDNPSLFYPLCSVDSGATYSKTRIQPECSNRDSYLTMKASNINCYPTDAPPRLYPLLPANGSTTTSTTMTLTSTPTSIPQDSLCGPLSPTPGTSPATNSIPCFAHGCGGRSFSSIGNYRRHMREKARRAKTFPCSMCGKVFTRSTARNMHQKMTKCLNGASGFGVEAMRGFDEELPFW